MQVPHTFPGQRLSLWSHSKGVLGHETSQTDLLFTTLNKSEALFSPSTRTRDMALGPALFHWESQSTTTTAASPTGQRTIHHEARGSRVLLFVREHRRERERPMAIRWRLERPIPAGWMQGMGLAV